MTLGFLRIILNCSKKYIILSQYPQFNAKDNHIHFSSVIFRRCPDTVQRTMRSSDNLDELIHRLCSGPKANNNFVWTVITVKLCTNVFRMKLIPIKTMSLPKYIHSFPLISVISPIIHVRFMLFRSYKAIIERTSFTSAIYHRIFSQSKCYLSQDTMKDWLTRHRILLYYGHGSN